MARARALGIGLGVVALFVAIVAGILWLRATQAITYELALLMLVALLGMYVGFGILIAVYRLIRNLD